MDSATPPGAGPDAGDPATLLARADALRDARDWIEAAIAYAAYLRVAPQDWPIWVQYGHCMKESGDVKAALLLYREAERLQPGDADLYLQIGHALKLLGRVEEAYQSYAKALTLDPGNASARAELLATPGGQAPPPPAPAPPVLAPPVAAPSQQPPEPVPANPPAPPPPVVAPDPAPAAPPAVAAPPAMTPAAADAVAPGALVFDASDLIDFFRHNRAPTGIQRVQLSIIGAALEQAGPAMVIAVFEPASGAWKRLPQESFRRLALLSHVGADPAEADWSAAVAGILSALLQAPPLAFAFGAALVNLGTAWWIPDYLRRVREAKAAAPGLRYVAFLHDCIPLVVPEHCAAGLVDEFARWFAGLCLHADLVLCNSACTEADFRRFATALLPAGAPLPPTAVVPLDAVTPLEAAAPLPPALVPPPLRAGRPYVLSVGTIESRKNHLLLFQAWLTMLRRHGAEATPDLVCVGKRGWLAEAALALHANSPALQEKVQLLHGVPDAALDALIRGALCTVQASHYEGWGLPVTESLARGRVAVLPAHSGFLESGAGGAVFYAPGSEPELVAALERLLFDPAQRAAEEARLAREVRLRSWEALTEALLSAVAGAVALPPPLDRLPPQTGAVHEPRLAPGPVPSATAAVAEALREGPCWSVPEPWGSWTLPGTARLRLPVAPGTRGAVRAHLMLLGPPPGPVRIGLRAAVPGQPPAPFRPLAIGAGERVACTLDLELPEGAAPAAIEIDSAEGVLLGGDGPMRDLRTVGAGLVAVMACRPDDLAARLAWLEEMALPRLVRL